VVTDYQDDYCRPHSDLRQVVATEENIYKYGLHKDDLIINRVNSPSHLGKCMVVQRRNLPSLFESNMMRLRLARGVNPRYVAYYLQSKIGKSNLIKKAKWAVNQASINQNDVLSTDIPIPPRLEQDEIVRKADQFLSQKDKLSHSVEMAIIRADRLRQSILKKAFSGRLVPSLPAYDSNSADELPMAAEATSGYGAKR
jgi:type I restriction enzyme S subunit